MAMDGVMIPLAAQPENEQPAFPKRCPYFGSADDPETATLYPSPIGCCYRSRPQQPITLEHQAAACLTVQFHTCPMLAQAAPVRLPKELRRKGAYQFDPDSRQSRWPTIVTWLLLGCLGVIFLWLGRTGWGVTPAVEEPAAVIFFTPTVSPTPEMVVTPTVRPSLTPTAKVLPTLTVPFTFTPRLPTATAPAPTATLTPAVTRESSPVEGLTAAALVNVRTGPHLSYPTAWQLEAAASPLTITGQTADGAWLQVCCANGIGGWVAREMLTVDDDLANVPVIPLPRPRLVIMPVRLNIRTGPGIVYPVLTIGEVGAEYEIIASYDEGLWWQICCVSGQSGWVIGESVTVYGATNTIPPAVIIPPTPTETVEP